MFSKSMVALSSHSFHTMAPSSLTASYSLFMPYVLGLCTSLGFEESECNLEETRVLSRFSPKHSFSSKVRSAQTLVQIMTWRYLILSFLLFSHFKSHTIKTRKADSIGIPIKNYLLGRTRHDPLVLLIGLP